MVARTKNDIGVNIRLTGEDAASKEIKNAEKSLDSMGREVSDVEKDTEQLTESTNKLSSALIAVASAYAAALAGGGIKDSILEADAAARKAAFSLGEMSGNIEQVDDAAREVFGRSFSESLTEAFDAAVLASKKLKAETADDIADIAKRGLAIQQQTNKDYADIIQSASEITERFGLTGKESLDFIARGFQEGLNSGDNFLQTIDEYAVQFQNAGFSAAEFYSTLKTGEAGGFLGVDKIADAVKEFGIRFQETSKGLTDAYASIGLSQEELQRKVNDGSLSIAGAFQIIQEALKNVDDSTTRAAKGAEIIGTQFEDLTNTVFKNVDLQAVKIQELRGASDDVVEGQENLIKSFQSIGNTFSASLSENKSLNESFKNMADFIDENNELIKELGDSVAEFASFIIDSGAAVGDFVDENKELATAMAGLLFYVKALGIIKALASNFTLLGSSADGASSGVKKLSLASAGAVGGVALLSTEIGSLIYQSDLVKENLASLADSIASFFGESPDDFKARAFIEQQKAIEENAEKLKLAAIEAEKNAEAQKKLSDNVDVAKNSLEAESKALEKLDLSYYELGASVNDTSSALERSNNVLSANGRTIALLVAEYRKLEQQNVAGVYDEKLKQLEVSINAASNGIEGFSAENLKATDSVEVLSGRLEKLKEIYESVSATGGDSEAAASIRSEIERTVEAIDKQEQAAVQSSEKIEKSQRRVTESVKETSEAVEGVSSGFGVLSQIANNKLAQVATLSKAAAESVRREYVEAFGMSEDALTSFADQATNSTESLQRLALEARQALRYSVDDILSESVGDRINSIRDATQRATLEFANQSINIQRLTDSYRGLESAAGQNVITVDQLKKQYNLLDESQLGGAISEINRLNDAARTASETLGGLSESLRDELDRIEGNNEEIEERRFQRQLQQIKELAAASGESAAEEIALARAIHNEKMKQYADEKEAKRQANAEREKENKLREQQAKIESLESQKQVQATPTNNEQRFIVEIAGKEIVLADEGSKDGLLDLIQNDLSRV